MRSGVVAAAVAVQLRILFGGFLIERSKHVGRRRRAGFIAVGAYSQRLCCALRELCGMRERVHLLQFEDRDLRVDLGRVEPRVTEHLLDEADVGAVLQHERRHGVAEQMAGARLADPRRVDDAAHELREAPGVERLAVVVEEERAGVGCAGRAAGRDIRADTSRSRECARSPIGTMRSFCPLPWRMITVPRSVSRSWSSRCAQLPAPHAGRVERLQDGAVARAERGLGDDGCSSTRSTSDRREHVFGQPLLQLGSSSSEAGFEEE